MGPFSIACRGGSRRSSIGQGLLGVRGSAMKQATDRAVSSPTGGPFHDRAAVAIVGESLADVAREALKIARVESQSRPVLLVDLLGPGQRAGRDVRATTTRTAFLMRRVMAFRWRASRGRCRTPTACLSCPGGAESPQADDVLSGPPVGLVVRPVPSCRRTAGGGRASGPSLRRQGHRPARWHGDDR